MKPEEKLKEIEDTFRIHKELAPSQIEWCFSEVKRLRTALEFYGKNDLAWFSAYLEGLDSYTGEMGETARKALQGDES